MEYITTVDLRVKYSKMPKEKLAKELKGKSMLFSGGEIELDIVNTRPLKDDFIVMYKVGPADNPDERSKPKFYHIADTRFLENFATTLGRTAISYKKNKEKFDEEEF